MGFSAVSVDPHIENIDCVTFRFNLIVSVMSVYQGWGYRLWIGCFLFSVLASQITCNSTVCSTACSG